MHYSTNWRNLKMSKVHDLTIGRLLELDGRIDIYFHRCGDLQTAYNKLKPYTSLGSIEKRSSDGNVWLQINDTDVNITAFL